jgi:hypothetical protein
VAAAIAAIGNEWNVKALTSRIFCVVWRKCRCFEEASHRQFATRPSMRIHYEDSNLTPAGRFNPLPSLLEDFSSHAARSRETRVLHWTSKRPRRQRAAAIPRGLDSGQERTPGEDGVTWPRPTRASSDFAHHAIYPRKCAAILLG